MKANGMRAWRQQARRWRRKQNRANRRTGAPWIADGTGRWYRRQQIWFTQRPVLPARVYPCDFVVGMTQGARKRAVLREMQREDHPLHNYRLDYWEARALYRLGERLRPCKGCESCLGRQCIGCEGGQLFEGDVCERCRRTATGERICDGSGVLPAKRHRRCGWWLKSRTAQNTTLRCGMPLTSGGWLDCQHCGGSGWLPAGRA